MPCQAEHFSYIQGHVVEMGLTMPPFQFCLSGKDTGFICFAQGLIFEGHALMYNPSTNKAKWIPVHGTVSNLSCMEEVSPLMLCNLVPSIPDEGASRLDWFGEHRDVEGSVGEASSTEVPHEEGPGEELMHEDELEDTEEGDTDDEETDEESVSSSGSSWRANALPTTTLTGAAILVAGLSATSQKTCRMIPL